jgi:HPt (histidine-containing phosphotransfer) domain-containing protein
MNSCVEVIDLPTVVRTVSGDMELLAELVGVFQKELPGMRSALLVALTNGDPAAVSSAAHRLKGSLLVLGALCASTAENIEQAARLGSLEEASLLATKLESEICNFVPAIQTLIKSEGL